MKDFRTWLVIGLLALVAYLILSRPSKPDSAVIIQARDSIQRITEANQILAMQGRTLELSLTEARAKSKIDSGRFKREISTLRSDMSRKRTQVQPLIDSVPDLREFVQVADNVIELQRQRIDSLEAEKQFQAVLYQDLIYVSNKKISNLNMIIAQKNLIIADQEKTIRKTKRGNRLLKAGVIALPIAAFILGSQL